MTVLNIIMLLVIWTWGLTPTWVNIISTILISIFLFLQFLKGVLAVCKDATDNF